MQEVDQAFLLAFAGVAGTLLGTFVVGVFFYIDSEMHMRLEVSEAADRYQRSSIRWVFTAYSVALFVPLVFAALHPLWGSLAFGLFGVVLLAEYWCLGAPPVLPLSTTCSCACSRR